MEENNNKPEMDVLPDARFFECIEKGDPLYRDLLLKYPYYTGMVISLVLSMVLSTCS